MATQKYTYSSRSSGGETLVYAIDLDTGVRTLVGRKRFDGPTATAKKEAKEYFNTVKAQHEASVYGTKEAIQDPDGRNILDPSGEGHIPVVYSVTATSPDEALQKQIDATKSALNNIDPYYSVDLAKANKADISITSKTGSGFAKGNGQTFKYNPSTGQYHLLQQDEFGKAFLSDTPISDELLNKHINSPFKSVKVKLDKSQVKTKDKTGRNPFDYTYVTLTSKDQVNKLNNSIADLESKLTGIDTEYTWDDNKATTNRTTTSYGSQRGAVNPPVTTGGETFGGTGALQTTQTTPGVKPAGTTTDYVQPAPTPVDPTTGTSSIATQTGNLSALPTDVTYATRPAGTPGYVQESLLTPSTSGTGPSTYDQWMQQTQETQQALEEQQAAQQQQGGYIVTMPDGTEQTISYGQPIPPGATIKQYVTGAAKGGMMRKGYALGGMPEDPMLEAKYRIAGMNGYNGPKTNAALNSFANSSEGMKRKFNAIGTMMNKGGLMKQGYQSGGVVEQNDSGQYIVQFPDGTATVFGVGETGKQQAEQYLASLPADTGTSVGITGSTDTTITSDTATTYVEGDEAVTDTAGETTTATDPGGVDFPTQYAQQYGNLIGGTLSPIQSAVSQVTPQAEDFVPLDAGQASPVAPFAEAAKVQTTAQSALPAYMQTAQMQPVTAYQQVQAETAGAQAAQGQVAPQAQVTGAQQTTSAVTGMQGAQGVSTDVVAPAPRDLQTGELIDPVANAASAAAFTEQVQAATATPSAQATVAGQLEGLMQQFEGGNTPAWAAGSMRTAMATLSARGLGASSLAGQAVIQATMEAALPIAQMDAQVQAQFESQNLTNRQQRAMLSAQQRATFLGMEFDQAFQARVQNSARIGDIANMNFSAEQNIALENARAANTMNLNNLSNRQAMVMAEAAALSNLDMANLNNRQQAAVQNAQSFLQMDMANLSNAQQTAIFKSQQNIQALFTDQAAENAAAQFNASSENQTNQFFANLTSQTSQFNASQQNAMDQFNVNSVNALREFNSEIQQQRDLFNAQNGLLVAQANAQWRQTIATANTAAQNESNMNFAKTINALTATNLDAYWQKERDVMSFAYASGESAADRVATILQTELEAELQAEYADQAGKGGLFATLLKGGLNYLGLAGGGKTLILPGAS